MNGLHLLVGLAAVAAVWWAAWRWSPRQRARHALIRAQNQWLRDTFSAGRPRSQRWVRRQRRQHTRQRGQRGGADS